MIYGDDVTHIVTEEGIANLLLCRDLAEREQAIRGVAGYTEVGLGRDRDKVEKLRDAASSGVPAISASTPRRPRAICWPRARSRIWCGLRAGSTTPRTGSATGKDRRRQRMEQLEYCDYRARRQARAARAGAGRRRRLRQLRGAGRARRRGRLLRRDREDLCARLRDDLGSGAARFRGTLQRRAAEDRDQRRRRDAGGRQPAPGSGDRGVGGGRPDAQLLRGFRRASVCSVCSMPARSASSCRPPRASPARIWRSSISRSPSTTA